jgi:L-histidine N-alpha-methyltransferase
MASPAPEQHVRFNALRAGHARRSALYEATRRSLQGEVKALPPTWLYDARGSRLYEEVTRLPEYYLPHRERDILHAHARAIAERTPARTLVELGPGSATNTRLLLDALDAAGTLERFVALDVSEDALRASAHMIADVYPRLCVDAFVGDFERDLGLLPHGGRRLIAFLGSTIGNLYPAQRATLLAAVADALGPDDGVLLGIDLVKDVRRLEAAYNDSRGVTEAFVRNALAAVNDELAASFDQARFVYEPRWDPDHEWMAIELCARVAHAVTLGALEIDVAFEQDEPLRVEISAKFRPEEFIREVEQSGLRVESLWTDHLGDFAVALTVADAPPQANVTAKREENDVRRSEHL